MTPWYSFDKIRKDIQYFVQSLILFSNKSTHYTSRMRSSHRCTNSLFWGVLIEGKTTTKYRVSGFWCSVIFVIFMIFCFPWWLCDFWSSFPLAKFPKIVNKCNSSSAPISCVILLIIRTVDDSALVEDYLYQHNMANETSNHSTVDSILNIWASRFLLEWKDRNN